MKIHLIGLFGFGLLMMSSCQTPIPCENDIVCEHYIHRYGVPLDSQEWSQRGQHGQIVSTCKDGVTITQTYEAGALNGACTYTFPHKSQLAKKEIYDHNRLTEEHFFFINGAPEKEIIYLNNQSYTIQKWDEMGAPQCREIYNNNLLESANYYDENYLSESEVNHFNGKRTIRDGHRQLLAVEVIENGVVVSKTHYHSNGAPATHTLYCNGQPHGEKRTYLVGGEPQTIEQWENGNQHGTTIEFDNGEKVAEISYSYGCKHGLEKRYRDGCILVQEINWVRGRKQGPCHTYVNGTILVDWYYGDRIVNKNTYDVLKSQE